ncbi:MAG: hypothetical protein U9P72_00770 [Campylobacterota bacterium]|nr:hypothetical protein [Campylobacterota bacterium]
MKEFKVKIDGLYEGIAQYEDLENMLEQKVYTDPDGPIPNRKMYIDDIEIDRTALEKLIASKQHIDYLESTDWYVTRLNETSKAIPDDIKQKRDECRAKLNE